MNQTTYCAGRKYGKSTETVGDPSRNIAPSQECMRCARRVFGLEIKQVPWPADHAFYRRIAFVHPVATSPCPNRAPL